jgi:hypothetical protein
MEVQLNWVGILGATLAAMVVGSLWYSPLVFGKKWMKLTGIDEKKAREGGNRAIGIAFVTAYVLAHVTYLSYQFFGGSYLSAALSTAFWVWLGFSAAWMVMHDAFELRPRQLTILNLGSTLVTLLAMALVIGLIGL